jgi:hypothetical protein
MAHDRPIQAHILGICLMFDAVWLLFDGVCLFSDAV